MTVDGFVVDDAPGGHQPTTTHPMQGQRAPQIVPSHPVSPVYGMREAGDIGRPLWLSATLSQGLQGAPGDRLATLIHILISPEKRLGAE